MAGGFLCFVPADAAQAGLRGLGRCISRPQARVLQPPTPISHPSSKFARINYRVGDLECSEPDDDALDRFARPFAESFLVSPIAMRIRLEKLGLLLAKSRTSGFLPAVGEPFF